MTKPRRFKGWAAFDGRGNLMWGTFSTSQERTRELVARFQPSVEGFDQGGYVAAVRITVEAEK